MLNRLHGQTRIIVDTLTATANAAAVAVTTLLERMDPGALKARH